MGGGVAGEGSCLWGRGSEEKKYWEHLQLGQKCVLDSDELYTKVYKCFVFTCRYTSTISIPPSLIPRPRMGPGNEASIS